MDFLDGQSSARPSSSTPSSRESRMRRFSKVLIFLAACCAALVLTIRQGGDGLHVGADPNLRAATRAASSKYDLSQLPIFSITLFYVRENYFDKSGRGPGRGRGGARGGGRRGGPGGV